MRSFEIAIVLTVLGVLVSAQAVTSDMSPPRPTDLSVQFAALTNNPGRSVLRRLSVVSGGRGLYALFAVTNTSDKLYVQFGISCIERKSGNGWKLHESESFKPPPTLGFMWSPGHGCLYAIPWPIGLGTNTSWRLQMWVMYEPEPKLALINQQLGQKLFPPHGRHLVTSSTVIPPPSRKWLKARIEFPQTESERWARGVHRIGVGTTYCLRSLSPTQVVRSGHARYDIGETETIRAEFKTSEFTCEEF